eukprot:SAG22_NODE_7476_length_736_cov_0.883830_1_plen_141_part_01
MEAAGGAEPELQEAVGVLLHEQPDITVADATIRLAAGWPSVPARPQDELDGVEALVEAVRPTFFALRHWEQLEPEQKEAAYAAVSAWLVDQACGSALQPVTAQEAAEAAEAARKSRWTGTWAGVGGGLVAGAGLAAGGWVI